PSRAPCAPPGGGGSPPGGGDRAHRGWCLSLRVELSGGPPRAAGCGPPPAPCGARHGIEHRHNDGCFIAVFNVDAFRPLEEFKEEVSGFAEFVKTSPPSGDVGVQYPGEPEFRNAQRLREEGIYIEDETWSRIEGIVTEKELADEIGEP
nr:Ldh family oxidoreductase [Candidatus Bathyarchaeota archaeon]